MRWFGDIFFRSLVAPLGFGASKGSSAEAHADSLLLETGDYLLLETGDRLLLE